MYRIHQIKLPIGESKEKIPEKILKKIGMKDIFVKDWKIVKESIDARDKENLCWVYSVDFQVASRKNPKKNLRLPSGGKLKLEIAPDMTYHGVTPGSGIVAAGSQSNDALQSTAPRLSSRPVVVGLGPAGLFCGLILAQAGYKPIVLERGRDVEQRHKDVENFWKTGVLNPESNVQFGEGGAGAFSDGKLTTGIKDVRIRKVLEEMVAAGAPDDILYKQKPHIGTDLLRTVVKNIRQQIVSLGGEVRFETRLEGLHWQNEPCGADTAVSAVATGDARTGGDVSADCDAVLADNTALTGDGVNCRKLAGITVYNMASELQATDTAEHAKPAPLELAGVQATGAVSAGKKEFIPCQVLVVAVGHSARDTFRMLNEESVAMEQKPFSIGVRIEHPQDLIDIVQYGKTSGELGLPPAEYKINYRCKGEAAAAEEADGTANANLAAGRGVYTFCMCPGGHVVAASSQEGGMVVNGMSYHDRDSGVANSALLCDVRTSDFGSDYVLAGVDFQEKYERLAFEAGRAQSREDRPEANSGRKFYSPAGTQPTAAMAYCPPKSTWSKLRDGKAPEIEGCLPDFAVAAFREAMPNLGKKLRGFDRDDAIVTGVETRSSSPVRMLRDGSCESVNSKGLYPCGEGAGYAGGITSAAVDGIRVAESIILGWLPAE